MLCVSIGAAVILALGEGEFSLAWRHSVTRDAWVETWEARPEGLRLLWADVKGPGAGLEIPDNAIRTAEGWRFAPELPPQREVVLAASGATGGGWTLCKGQVCHEIGAEQAPPLRLHIEPGNCN